MNKIYRSRDDRILAGVCGGMGKALGIDSNLLRLIWIILVIPYGIGLIAYIAAWFLFPQEDDEDVINAEYRVKE
ncbi:PspC domain-containing protein [Methanoplanus sp. FWC-SCC4]|uniref:PspC domain-containing protein n=1 Tax=Methanochimaera problematica TaxID=2609417 RepID=A0AA97FDY8_9EURY|nr:PspC domain-containing protein [Methanoplanus sp. FWC-SCC4]WOF15696.1 PspC domain-containing protein [Methanoplanus sp. FWC-SCC4]